MPSNAILEQKKQIVADLAEQIKASASGVVVNYQGITVESDTALRKALREAGVKYVVMKNTLTGRACDMCGYGDMKQYLNGMTAIAISGPEDPIAPAKIRKEYAGEVINEAGVNDLASIPSKEILLAKFLGSIKSPLYNFAYAIQAIIDKGEDSAEAPAAEEAAPAEAAEAPAAE